MWGGLGRVMMDPIVTVWERDQMVLQAPGTCYTDEGNGTLVVVLDGEAVLRWELARITRIDVRDEA